MIDRIKIGLANLVWFASAAWKSRRWRKSARNVEAAQDCVLRRLISRNASTRFGRGHHFSKIDSVTAFQERVPIRSYDDFLPYIVRIEAGEVNVLTADPVRRFGLSSGSVKASKLIPYTDSLVAEFQAGIDPWVFRLFSRHPQLIFSKAYWSVTPVGDRKKLSSGGVPIGFDDERSYFDPVTQWVLDTTMAAPSSLALIEDMDSFRRTTLKHLLVERSLGWLSIWNPTFLNLLLEPLEHLALDLVRDIAGSKKTAKRAKELAEIFRRRQGQLLTELNCQGKTGYEEIWPNLQLISCWTHGHAATAVAGVERLFPNVVIEPKGLMATEAMISFPFSGDASALSIDSHFFEFEEVGQGGKVIKLAHELRLGGRYAVIVTTSGGFYRYRLGDVIEVLGFEQQCPLIRFVGRQDKVVDICGEKLNEFFVDQSAREVIAQYGIDPKFWMVAPEVWQVPPFYTLFIQTKDISITDDQLVSIGRDLDTIFRLNYHYDYCRRLGQLGQCRVFAISRDADAGQVYLATCCDLGQRLGDIKPVTLHSFGCWSGKFAGKLV